MLIDLRKIRDPLTTNFQNSLRAFSAANGNLQIATVGLWGDGFHGTASLHLDTPEHSAAFASQWMKKGPEWFGQDDEGTFCNSCWDFPHCVGEYSFPEYPDLYESDADSPVEYIALDGTRERVESDEGDEGYNRVVFPFLKTVLTSFLPFPGLQKSVPFRIGVRMRDSEFSEFWIVKVG